MTQTVATAFAALVQPFIGRTVEVTDRTGNVAQYTIARLSDKLGKLKDGTPGEYVVLTKNGEDSVVINLHPQHAKRLVTKGEDSGIKLVEAEAAAELSAKEQETVSEELAAEQTGEPAADATSTEPAAGAAEAEAPKDEAPAAKAPRVTKKSQAVAIYTTMTAEGKPRKDIIAAFKAQLGLSDAGSNTYYQNLKSGKWV